MGWGWRQRFDYGMGTRQTFVFPGPRKSLISTLHTHEGVIFGYIAYTATQGDSYRTGRRLPKSAQENVWRTLEKNKQLFQVTCP